MIKVCIKGQKITDFSSPQIVAESIDYITAAFHFLSSDWEGLTKYAHFSSGKENYDIKLVDDVISADKHLNFTAGEWTMWVHGSIIEGGELRQRITTDEVTFYVRPTGTTDTGNPFPSAVPSMTEQILAEIGELDGLETANKQTLVDAINEVFRTAGGEISPELIAAAVEKYLEENPVEAVSDHEELTGRDKENQHPIKAVAGLQTALDGKQPKGEYLTEETDPNVPEWAKKPEKPTYTAEEVGALPDSTEIPNLEGYATEQFVKDEIGKIELPEGGGGSGVTDHADLTGRDKADQHPISAVTGLEEQLLRPGVNLLHNADWAYSLVNQRGHSGAVSDAYCIDRWIGNGTVTTVAGQYVTLTAGTTMTQYMEILPAALIGRDCCISVEVGNEIWSAPIAFPATTNAAANTVSLTGSDIELGFLAYSTTLCGVTSPYVPYIKLTETSAINVKRVFLEFGDKSHMSETAPREIAANIAICQRYLYDCPDYTNAIGMWLNATYFRIISALPKMRISTPSVTVRMAEYYMNNAWAPIDGALGNVGGFGLTINGNAETNSAGAAAISRIGFSASAEIKP